jgi:DNA helicase-2/ATP-dependent DNA helicase PcrA
MIRGETQFIRVSRFVKEIPSYLLGGTIYEPKAAEEQVQDNAYQRARKAFRTNVTSYGSSYDSGYANAQERSSFGTPPTKTPTYTPVLNQRTFESSNTLSNTLSYEVGDRVRHIKFGDGEVMAIVAGGRDYEVTVDFDKAGTKKLMATYAKLLKI